MTLFEAINCALPLARYEYQFELKSGDIAYGTLMCSKGHQGVLPNVSKPNEIATSSTVNVEHLSIATMKGKHSYPNELLKVGSSSPFQAGCLMCALEDLMKQIGK